MSDQQIVSASAEIGASADVVFELIADPARQPEWDGNDNLTVSESPRVTTVGDVFLMTLTNGHTRENHVVQFEEGRLIAWRPSPIDSPQPGHQWGWEVEPIDATRCRVTHIYDWTHLTDETRMEKARSTTSDHLQSSIDRLKSLAESL